MADKIIVYKAADTGTVVLPSDMSSVNTVINIGAGAGGSAGTTTLGGRNPNGGSSGGIHIATNVTLTANQSVQIQVGSGGTGGTFGSTATDARGTAGGNTWLNGVSLAAAVVGAQGGQIAADSFSATVGGASFGTAGGTKTNGSAGGAGSSASGSGSGAGAPGTTGAGGAGVVAASFSGGSGGGAADGGTAGSLATNTLGAAGGTRTGGSGGAGGAVTDANGTAGVAGNGGGGGAGNNGIGGAGSFPVLWTVTDGAYAGQTFGPGSGGGAGGSFGVNAKGGAGSYGAGGGGAYGSGKAGGDGGDGLIIIIYTPSTPTPTPSSGPRGAIAIGIGIGLPFSCGGGASSSPAPTPTDGADYGTVAPWLTVADAPTKPPALTGGTATITTGSSLQTQLAALSGSEGIVYCAGGNYGATCDISAYPAAGQVRLMPADPANPPYFSATTTDGGNQPFKFTNAGNLWFDGWEFRSTNITTEADASLGHRIVTVTGCTNIRFSRGKVIGSRSSPNNYPQGNAFKVLGSTKIQFDRITLQNLAFGFIFDWSGTDICHNCYVGFIDFKRSNGCGTADFIEIAGIDKLLIEWCQYWDTYAVANGLHTDFAQWFVVNTTHRGSSNVIVRRNLAGATANSLYVNGPDLSGNTIDYMQFVFAADETGTNDFPNVLVENNELYGVSNNAIVHQAGPRNLLIRNNKIVRSSRSDYSSILAQIKADKWAGMPGEQIDNVTIINNQAALVTVGSGATNVTNTGNAAPSPTSLDDTGFLAAKTVWEAARAVYI